MGILSNVKDRLLERAAVAYLNRTILAPYGRARTLEIDSTAKTIRIVADLHGETTPLEIEIARYKIVKEGNRYFAEVNEVRTSRAWLTTLAANQLRDRRFRLPAEVGRWMARLLD